MSVSAIRDLSSGSVYMRTRANTPKIKENDVWVDNKKIKFSQDFAKTTRSINRLYSKTGIKAEHVINGKKERLVLTVRSSILNIKDPKGALAALYKVGQIGKGADKIIQIKRSGKGHVNLKYSEAERKLPLLKGLVLSCSNVIQFAQSRNILHPLQEIERDVALPREIPAMQIQALRENNIPDQLQQEDMKVDMIEDNLDRNPNISIEQNIFEEEDRKLYTEREIELREQILQAAYKRERTEYCILNSDFVVEKLEDKIGEISSKRKIWLNTIISTELFNSNIEESIFKNHINEISDAIFDQIDSKRGLFGRVFSKLWLSEKEVQTATQYVLDRLVQSRIV